MGFSKPLWFGVCLHYVSCILLSDTQHVTQILSNAKVEEKTPGEAPETE